MELTHSSLSSMTFICAESERGFDHGGADFVAHRSRTLTLGRYANGWQTEELILWHRELHICLLLAFLKGCALMLVNLHRDMKKNVF